MNYMIYSIKSVGSNKFKDLIYSSEFPNRLENFVFVELQSKGSIEGPLASIKAEYYNLLYKIKGMMIKKVSMNAILNSFFDYSLSVFRILIKSAKGFDQKKTSNVLLQMASMDKRVEEHRSLSQRKLHQ